MKYKLEELSADEIVLIGMGIETLTIKQGFALNLKLQSQVNAQEIAERDRLAAEENAAVEAWRESERSKLKTETARPKRTASRKKGK